MSTENRPVELIFVHARGALYYILHYNLRVLQYIIQIHMCTYCWPVRIFSQIYGVRGWSAFRDCWIDKAAGRGIASWYWILSCWCWAPCGVVCARPSTNVDIVHRSSLCTQFFLTSPLCTSIGEPNLIKNNFRQWETDTQPNQEHKLQSRKPDCKILCAQFNKTKIRLNNSRY